MSFIFTKRLYKSITVMLFLVLTGCSDNDPPNATPPDNDTAGAIIPVLPQTTDSGQSAGDTNVPDSQLLVNPADSSQDTDDSANVSQPATDLVQGSQGSSGSGDVTAAASGVRLLAAEDTIEGTLAENQSHIYQVDSGIDISLISNTGDVDLFLFDNMDDFDSENLYNNENLLCGSWWEFEEDICSASVTDGVMFAYVIAYEDSNYQINVTTECSVPSINRWVDRSMRDFYLYADQVSDINPDSYTDPAELVRDLRFEELDPFSYLADAAQQSSFFEAGIEFGFGWRGQLDDNGALRVIYVYDDSPFGRAGVKRGDIVVAIEGESYLNMTDQRYFELIGSQENPIEATWEFIDGETGESYFAAVARGEYRVNSVLHSDVYENAELGGPVGYLVLKQFIEPTTEELNAEMANFASRGVTELVLDLRYNGGGRIRVARRLAEQIAGSVVDGNIEAIDLHNEEYSSSNFTTYFSTTEPALNLNRLIVLTTERTASASERIFNTLGPYIDVVNIGTKTRGKPFTSYGRTYCGKTLNAMQTESVNAAFVSVAGGVDANCYASDDFLTEFGSNEGMLKTALDYVRDGICLAEPQIASRSAKKSTQKHFSRFNENTLFEIMSE